MKTQLTSTLVVCALLLAGCSDDGGTAPMPDNTRRPEVLANLGENVLLPTYRELAARTADLVSATEAYAASPSPATQMAARDAWTTAMAALEEAELMQVGPYGAMGANCAAGGQDVRFEVYAWPTLNRCVVDQDTASERYADPDALAAETIDRRGYGAIEYLLFVDTPGNACSPLSPINEDGTWAAFSEADIEARRARHANTLAVIVARHVDGLVATWDGGFLTEFTDPTRSGALYGSAQEGLQAVTDGMFYLDQETKDMKLAEPMGISLDCTTPTCPDSRESRHANRSKEHIVANLRAFQRLYLGGDAGGDELGFDDLLRDMGAGAFADELAGHITAAITATEAIPGTLAEAIEANFAAVMAAYDAIKLVTDELKTMFLTVLDLEAPMRAAGDND